tara:strand:- start:620 stop:853 length:234 start_codon:yes stop_codon:yes gene_type:complete
MRYMQAIWGGAAWAKHGYPFFLVWINLLVVIASSPKTLEALPISLKFAQAFFWQQEKVARCPIVCRNIPTFFKMRGT